MTSLATEEKIFLSDFVKNADKAMGLLNEMLNQDLTPGTTSNDSMKEMVGVIANELHILKKELDDLDKVQEHLVKAHSAMPDLNQVVRSVYNMTKALKEMEKTS